MEIKFSHDYPKLHGQNKATLMSILIRERSDMSDSFVEYDTVYDGGHYPLPPGGYLVLVFLGCDLIPFTTVRKFSHDKFMRYYEAIGETFDIVVKQDE